MDKIHTWLDSKRIEPWIREHDRSGTGILVMAWDGGESAGGRRSIPLRLKRLFRASAMRLSKNTGDVIQWLVTDGEMIGIVRQPPGEDDGHGDFGLTRLLFSLRETAFRLFTGPYGRFRFRDKDRIVFGFASIGQANDGIPIENVFVSAVIQAWRMSQSAAAPFIELAGTRTTDTLPLGERVGVRFAPIVSLTDGSLFGYTAIPYDRISKTD